MEIKKRKQYVVTLEENEEEYILSFCSKGIQVNEFPLWWEKDIEESHYLTYIAMSLKAFFHISPSKELTSSIYTTIQQGVDVLDLIITESEQQ